MAVKVERQSKPTPYEFKSKMRDVGTWTATLVFLRRRPKLDNDINSTICRMLLGYNAVLPEIGLQTRAIATVMCGVQKGGLDPDDSSWVDDILDPGIIMDIYLKWLEYQASFSATGADDAAATAVQG